MATPIIQKEINNYSTIMNKLMNLINNNESPYDYTCLYNQAMDTYTNIIDMNQNLRNVIENKLEENNQLMYVLKQRNNNYDHLVNENINLMKIFDSIIDPKTPKTILQNIK